MYTLDKARISATVILSSLSASRSACRSTASGACMVEGTFYPLCRKIVTHDPRLKSLQLWVLDLIQAVIIQNGHKGGGGWSATTWK